MSQPKEIAATSRRKPELSPLRLEELEKVQGAVECKTATVGDKLYIVCTK